MKFQKKVLANGLMVLFEKRDVDVTTVMLGVRYGSGYDSVEEKGMAHFIEHLCFKGTEKRKTREIVYEIESLGGDVNAYTFEKATMYLATLPSNHVKLAMDVIFDIFFNPIFPKEDVGREAGVICEEIKMNRDNPMRHCFDKIAFNLYEEPFGINGAGSPEIVRGMTREQLIKKHNEIYVPKNSILSIVGNNDFDEIVSLAERLISEMKPKEVDPIIPDMPEVKRRLIRDEENRSGLEQSNVVLGVHFPRACEKLSYAAEVFSAVLGEGMSSRLFTEVREKRGLVYAVKTILDNGPHHGYLVIWAGTDSSKVEEVKGICLKEFAKMENITQKELDEAKIQVIGKRKVESEGSTGTALNLIFEEISGKAENYYDYEKMIGEVTLDEIRGLAGKTEFASFSLGP